jgi:single-strand DNA-binding protein
MINQSVLEGRITRDLELRYTGNGIAVLNFNIAVDRPFKNQQGERETDFINVVAFRKTAETIKQYFSKGQGISIVGRIQTRNYENNEGRTIYVTEVVIDQFSFPIQNKNNNQGNQQQNNQQNYSNQNQQQNRNQQNNPNNNPFENVDFSDNPFETNEDVTDISDDDLPF